MTSPETVAIFGYGSLVFAPELAEACAGRHTARLFGYRRSFNKRSRARACPTQAAWDAFPNVPEPFRTGGLNYSLALGTVPHPASAITGILLVYPEEVRDEVLTLTDVREGFDPQQDSVHNGYLRSQQAVALTDSRKHVAAHVYLTNPDPACTYYVSPAVSLDVRARILINATPREPDAFESGARGLTYLEGIRRDLYGVGVVDAYLEEMAAAVLRHEGPWCEAIASPRSPT